MNEFEPKEYCDSCNHQFDTIKSLRTENEWIYKQWVQSRNDWQKLKAIEFQLLDAQDKKLTDRHRYEREQYENDLYPDINKFTI